MKPLIQKILRLLSKLIVKRYRPKVIGITGSVGKTSAKEAIFTVLDSRFRTRKNIKNYNNEIGVPLTIIGEETAGKSVFGWLKIFLKAIFLILFKTKEYPEVLILELGVDHPGDMEYLTGFAKCNIGVVSAIGDTPVHIEFFETKENIVKEKSVLIKSLSREGLAVLNYDDKSVLNMKNETEADVLTFGFNKGADIRAIEVNSSGGHWVLEGGDKGTSFKVVYQGSTVPVRLFKVFGTQQIYAVLAATAVGLSLDINLVEIVEMLRLYESPPGRMRFINGIKHTLIIDDSYNASPLSTKAALKVLNELKSVENENSRPARKIAVLGDMLELGSFSEEAHREIGKISASVVSVLITVGGKSKFIAEEAIRNGMDKNKVFVYNDSSKAGKHLQEILRENDMVLVKGSQGMRMERVVEEVMAEPEKAKELLVRQDGNWKKEL